MYYRTGLYHNDDGPLKVDYNGGDSWFKYVFLEAALERGNKRIDEINSDALLGYTPC